MRCLKLAFVISLICTAPVIAGVRDVNLGIDDKFALSLVRFDAQPDEVFVQASADGIEIVIKGVEAKKTRIEPPDTQLVTAIDVRPVENGIRLIYHFNEPPLQSEVKIYAHSVLLRAQFNHALQVQTASLRFAPAATNTTASVTHDKTSIVASITPAPKDEQINTHQNYDENAPTRDGDVATSPPVPVRGTGLVRDASATKITPQRLDAKSCAAAELAIEDDPWALDKLSLYGACIAKEGKNDEAKEVFERLLTFDPDMISAYMGLGAIAQESGNAALARRHYQQALGLGGTDAQAAQVRVLLGTLGEAH